MGIQQNADFMEYILCPELLACLAYSNGIIAHDNNRALVLDFLQCIFELVACNRLKRE